MKGKGFKSILVLAALTMGTTLAACSNARTPNAAESETPSQKKTPVEITLIDSWDQTTDQGKFVYGIYKRFQDQYADTIKLNIESTPNLDAMIQKVKMMFATGTSPDLFNGSGYDITTLGIKKDGLADLKPYLDADPEFKSWVSQANIDFNTNKDGQLISLSPNVGAIALWYNKELFAKANIQPAKTWEEFWDNCEKLKAAGITPLSMDTKDTAWITNLLLGAIIGTSNEAGAEFMSQLHPTNFNTPEVIAGLKMIQKAFKEYAPINSAGADYNLAANSFLTGKTAMIFNGPWMAGDFADKTKTPEGFADKVGVSLYPNDSAYFSGTSGYTVGNNGKEKVDAAVTFIKFMQSPEVQAEMAVVLGNYPDNPLVQFTDEQKAQARLFIESVDVTNSAKTHIKQNYQAAWFTNVTDAFTTLYPELIFDKITPEQLAQKLTELAQKNK